jgi:transposase/signal recognition particle subunit SEC65
MSKTFRPYEPDQDFLMPASMRDWLPSDHLAYFISDLVDQLDISAIMIRYQEEKGYPPYHPAMMVKVLLYAYCIGVPSSRKIEKRLCEDIAFRVLAANNTPDFRTISDFRKDHLKALAGLFLQVLKLCQKAGLVKLGHVALDGTKIKANASKHKAMSYKRMKEEEARLETEVAALMKKAEAVDEEEDCRYGKDKRGDELPKELAFRESRLKKIREAREALEEEAKREAEIAAASNKKHPGVPDDKAQRNFTDPESRIMPAPGGKHFIQAYNAQAAVDSAHQVIVAAEVTNKPADRGQAEPMMEMVKENTGKLPRQMSADAGYFSSDAVKNLSVQGIDVYMPPDKMGHRSTLPPAPRGRIPKTLSIVDRMRRKLRTKKGKERYGLRKVTPEPVFGQIKQARGFRQFLLRGEDKTGGEWKIICAGHNLLKLFGAHQNGLFSQRSPATVTAQ